jgi:outer membrane protein assembly factor BamB
VPYEAGSIHAIAVEGGRDLWDAPFAVGDEVHGGVSYAEVDGRGIVFLGSRTAWAHAVAADTGKKLWHFFAGLWVDSTPSFAVIDGRPLVFFGTYTFHIIAADARTGEEVWRYRTRGIVQGSPALAFMGDEPVLCVNALDSHVYVVSARDGRFIFRHHCGKFPWTHYLKGKTVWSSCIVADLGDGPLLIAPSYSGVVTAFAVNGQDANAGPPSDSFWDALGEIYTIPAFAITGFVLFVTLRRLVRRARQGARPDPAANRTDDAE